MAAKLKAGDSPREVDLDRLKPSSHDYRSITDEKAEALWRAIERRPGMLWARPIVALPDGTIVAGHRRYEVLIGHDVKRAPVFVADLDDAEADEWMVADNRPFGEDDETKLARLVTHMQDQGADLPAIGYDPDEVDDLLASAGEIPELPIEPFAGGFAESPDELADREGRNPTASNGAGGDPLREVRLMLKPRVHSTFIRRVNELAEVYGKPGIIATVVEAVKREHDRAAKAAKK